MQLNQKTSLIACRFVFFSLLIICIIAAINIGQSINIDTNLADVSPKTNNSALTDNAIEQLSSSIQKRIILLISSNDEDSVYDAQDELNTGLEIIKSITLQTNPDDLSEKLIEGLKPYRFSLLTDEQRVALLTKSVQTIAKESENSLYDLSSNARIYDFNDDPLGWHSDTLFDLLNTDLLAGGPQESSDTFYAVVPISINQGALNINSQTELSQQLDYLISQIKTDYDVDVDRSGIFFFATHAAKSSKQDITVISTFSTIGIVLLILLVFRSFRALLLPVVSIAIGVGVAFVCTHLLYGNVHILTIVFGASLIGIVVDYSLHYFYHQASNTDHKQTKALYKALTFSLMTSIIGYTALSFSSLQALQKVATFSCLGLFMAWLSVICLGSLGVKKQLVIHRTIFTFAVELTTKLIDKLPRSIWTICSLCILLLASFIFIQYPPFNDSPKVFFTAPEHLLKSEQKVASVANDYEPGRYIIMSGETKSQLYQRHDYLVSLIEKTENLSMPQFTTLLSLIPDFETQESDYKLQEKLYVSNSDNLSAANLLRQSLGQDSSNDLTNKYKTAQNNSLNPNHIIEILGDALPPLWFSNQNGFVNFVLIKKGVNADSLNSLLVDVDGVEYVNTLERTEIALSEQRQSATKLLLLAYFLVGLLIIIYYRSLTQLSLLVVPACSSAMLLIMSFILNFDLNLFHVMALFLVLGFGMDYTIFSKEMREQQDITLEAILLSACTSLLSFGLLSLSSIPVVASFGITLLIGNIFNLLGAFIYARSQLLST